MPERPATNIRFVILFLTTVVAVLLYLDRICLSFVEIYVSEGLNLTKQQMGLVLSSFFLTYAVAQVPAGWLSDRYGARVMLSIYLVGWSLCTGLLGLATSVFTLVLLRLGCGLFQAGAYPTSAALIRRWIPFPRRGLASSVVAIGGRLGGAFAAPLTAYLMISFVPLETSSLLTPGDILPSKADALVAALHDPESYFQEKADAANDKPEDIAKRKTQVAVLARIADRLTPETAAFLKNVALFTPKDIDRAMLETILADVNRVLALPYLLADLDLSHLRLPASTRQNLERKPDDLSEAQIQRTHRLVLEATLPDIIRKIYGTGWRPVMFVYGAVGVLFAVLFWWFFRDSPRQHPKVNPAELTLIEGDDPSAKTVAAITPSFPWIPLLTSRSLWLLSAVQFLTNLGWVFLITWFPTYLAEVHRVPVDERSWMALFPLFFGIAGMFLGGWLTDWAAHRLGVKRGRILPMFGSRFLAGAAFFLCLVLDAPWPVTLAMVVVAFATDLGTPAMWAYCLDVGGKNTGAILGWGNMWGNLGAAVSPVLLEAIRAGFGYNGVFIVCGAGFVLSGFLTLGVDATKPIAANSEN